MSQALFWNFEFLNKHGATDLLIAHGDQMRSRYKALGWDFDINGRLALIELGRAYQSVGRSAEALEIAAQVSKKGGYAGQEADKLMSLIIRTAENKESFSPEILASGANGAYVAAAKNPSKYAEAINLYQIVLANLNQVEDAEKKTLLGREAYYRIGKCNDKLGRAMEAYVALEQAYKKYNNNTFGDDRKINEKVGKYWTAVASDIEKATGRSAFAKDLKLSATDWIINHPPVGGGGSETELLWRKAGSLMSSKNYSGALETFEKSLPHLRHFKSGRW